jgi:hypothetical protein
MTQAGCPTLRAVRRWERTSQVAAGLPPVTDKIRMMQRR